MAFVDEPIDISKMGINVFIALGVLGCAVMTLASGYKIQSQFEHEQTQNKLNAAYAKYSSFDGQYVDGSDIISLYMDDQGETPIFVMYDTTPGTYIDFTNNMLRGNYRTIMCNNNSTYIDSINLYMYNETTGNTQTITPVLGTSKFKYDDTYNDTSTPTSVTLDCDNIYDVQKFIKLEYKAAGYEPAGTYTQYGKWFCRVLYSDADHTEPIAIVTAPTV